MPLGELTMEGLVFHDIKDRIQRPSAFNAISTSFVALK